MAGGGAKERPGGRWWRRGLLAAAGLVAVVAACGGGGPKTSPGAVSDAAVPQNLFVNPGFEGGEAPWSSLATQVWGTPFQVSREAAHSGQQSAFLQMRASSELGGTGIFGVVQEIAPKEFPELLSGYYRVENWQRGTQKQYLQFVVIVWGATNLPAGIANYQIRYPLAGIAVEPFAIRNAMFVFIGREQPAKGRWVYFERDIRQDFQELWGAVPEGFSKIRILFEVRYEDWVPGSGTPAADVFYDDLYVGPREGNPNRP